MPETTIETDSASKPAIELQGASKRYGDAMALHPTDLTMSAGATTVLIGPSGCGKSTLLRLIVGLVTPSSGSVFVAGRPVTRATSQEVRRSIGYVIQDGGLFPHLTAEQNVLLMARHLKRPAAASLKRVHELAELVRLPHELLSRYPVELSGGQKQRISLMRALMLEPAVLLLDEPLGALDPMVRAALQTDLRDIFHRLRQTVLLVTHDMAEAAYLGHLIVLFKEGKVVQAGSLDDLKTRPSDPFVSEFMNAQRSLVDL